jgi:multicomponent Na+:H+ antiporter subunit D
VVNVVSGVLLLAGAAVHAHETGSIEFTFLGLDGLASWLILLSFGIKAGFPLLHNWIVDAYPEATPTGTVFLSAFTTKVAVYALARAFPGTDLLIWVGVVMTAFPIFYAVIENDLRRVLAYSMINQIGFMIVGIGLGTALSINGAVAHAFNDVIFKGLLMMSMGAVLYRTGKINGTDLGGLYKSMPLTASFSLVGAASISALPLFSGFVSKSMVMAAAMEEGYGWVWVLLLFASAGVVEHAGIKIPFFSFFAHDSGIRTKEAPTNMLLAMGLASLLCIVIGVFPQWTVYRLLPFPVDYHPYDTTHVITQLQLLFFSSLAVFWMMRTGWYPPEKRSVNLDSDWSYRWLAPRVVRRIGQVVGPLDRGFRRLAMAGLKVGLRESGRALSPSSGFSRHYPTGFMVLWVSILLGAYLLFYFL